MSRPPHKHDFLPAREAELLAWSRNFSQQINLDPVGLGLTVEQAAHYVQLHDAFAAAYRVVQDPATDSRVNVIAKNSAKTTLIANARMLARIIRANPSLSNDQRVRLRLTVEDDHLTQVATSDDKPLLIVTGTFGRTVRVRIRSSASSTRRARPAGSVGAVILSSVAAQHSAEEITPPGAISKWQFCGIATRQRFDVSVPFDVPPGAKIWITACWVNTRGKCGPMSTAVCTRIGDGVAKHGNPLQLAA